MKKVCLLLLLLFLLSLCGCNSFRVEEIENFNESDCCYGLNEDLLPGGFTFLDNFPYENGKYQYWRNNFGPAEAKTFVQLQFSESVYLQAKSECQKFFSFSEEHYYYEGFAFAAVDVFGGSASTNVTFPGVRFYGYDDNAYSLIFIGYLNESDSSGKITPSNFADFFHNNFGEYKIGDGLREP